MQDIHKKYILGTYRIKQNLKKISTLPRIEPALSRLQDQRTNHSNTVEAIAGVRFKAYCEEYNNLNSFKSLDLSEAYRNTDHPLPGPTFLKGQPFYMYFLTDSYAVMINEIISTREFQRNVTRYMYRTAREISKGP